MITEHNQYRRRLDDFSHTKLFHKPWQCTDWQWIYLFANRPSLSLRNEKETKIKNTIWTNCHWIHNKLFASVANYLPDFLCFWVEMISMYVSHTSSNTYCIKNHIHIFLKICCNKSNMESQVALKKDKIEHWVMK